MSFIIHVRIPSSLVQLFLFSFATEHMVLLHSIPHPSCALLVLPSNSVTYRPFNLCERSTFLVRILNNASTIALRLNRQYAELNSDYERKRRAVNDLVGRIQDTTDEKGIFYHDTSYQMLQKLKLKYCATKQTR